MIFIKNTISSALCTSHLQSIRELKKEKDKNYSPSNPSRPISVPRPVKTPSTADPRVKASVLALCDTIGVDNVARNKVMTNLTSLQRKFRRRKLGWT